MEFICIFLLSMKLVFMFLCLTNYFKLNCSHLINCSCYRLSLKAWKTGSLFDNQVKQIFEVNSKVIIKQLTKQNKNCIIIIRLEQGAEINLNNNPLSIKMIKIHEAPISKPPPICNSHQHQLVGPIKQNKKCYTQVIFQDDNLFRNVEIKGKSVQCDGRTDASRSEWNRKHNKSEMSEIKNSLRNSIMKNREQHCLLAKWVTTTSKIIQSNEKKQSNKSHKKSITVQSVEKIKKNSVSNGDSHTQNSQSYRPIKKNLRKMNQTTSDKMFNTPLMPSLQYQQKTFDQQTHCNFRQIIQQFNLAKRQMKQKQLQKNKQTQREGQSQLKQSPKQETTDSKVNKYKPLYRKPNYYHYQQFFRQNYQAKQLKQTMFLFKKCSYLSRSQTQSSKQKNSKQNQDSIKEEDQIMQEMTERRVQKYQNKEYKRFKRLGVYVYQQEKDQKMLELAQKNFQSLIALQPYLHVKTHQFSKTQRKNFKKRSNCMNKTSYNFRKNNHQPTDEQEKIQPWGFTDHGEPGF